MFSIPSSGPASKASAVHCSERTAPHWNPSANAPSNSRPGAGRMAEGELAPQIAEVESKLMEIQAEVAELDALRETDDEAGSEPDRLGLLAGACSKTGWEAASGTSRKGSGREPDRGHPTIVPGGQIDG